jgi:Ni/Co efflux regulator RcnB
MNQKSLVIAVAAMFAMVATIALATPQAFAQNVTNKGVEEEEDDDTTNISSTPTKVKSDANCNMGGFANWCDENESEAEIEVEE